MSSTNFNLISNHVGCELGAKSVKLEHSLGGELGAKSVKLEHSLGGRSLQQNEHPKFDSITHEESNLIGKHEYEKNRSFCVLNASHSGTIVWDQQLCPTDDFSLCSTSSMCPAPLCRQFWKTGNYEDKLDSKPMYQKGASYLHIHPKFLHSNATSHKWAFGAMAELLDNAVDEIKNGATYVNVDKISNPRDGTPALLIQDDGGGMDPEAMRRCLSFGFSEKNSKTAIGQYGNGFKTSSMRLGSDVVVFSRQMKNRKLTQSIGLLSYTFLMQTRQDRIVIPMVDYQFNAQTGTWNTLHNEDQLKKNLAILLQWSPFITEAELMKQCDDMGGHGTKIIIYNLWHNDEGKLELDFESDLEDICVYGKGKSTAKPGSWLEVNQQHLANRLHHSLRAYLSILYLRIPENFYILLRGRVVEYHNIANDLKFPQFIVYKPLNVECPVITTIGFLKEAPLVNIHGFNVYHKNRLILPFWHVVTYRTNRGRGVVGVLEANFIEPIHNKQDFEKTSIFQKLETRLKEMMQEYWDYHCELIGYQRVKKKPQATVTFDASLYSLSRPILLDTNSSGAIGSKVSAAIGDFPDKINASTNHVAAKSGFSVPSIHGNSQGVSLKRKGHDHVVDPERLKRIGVIDSKTIETIRGGDAKPADAPANPLENQEAAKLYQKNRKLHTKCQEYEKIEEALNLKVNCLRTELRKAQCEYVRLLLESKSLEKVKENRGVIYSGLSPN